MAEENPFRYRGYYYDSESGFYYLTSRYYDSEIGRFINTGRGAQVDETALIEKLMMDDTVTAVLDVTFPEPPEAGSPFYTLPNVMLTPHIAGSAGNEVWRMAEYMYEESLRAMAGEDCLYEVDLNMLETMA